MKQQNSAFSILGAIGRPAGTEVHMQTRFSITPCLVQDSCTDFNGHEDNFDIQSLRSVEILTRSAAIAAFQNLFGKCPRAYTEDWWGNVPEDMLPNRIVAFRLSRQTIYETGALGRGAVLREPGALSGLVHVGQLSTIGTQVAALSRDIVTDEDARYVKGAWISNLFANVGTTLSETACNAKAQQRAYWPLVENYAQAKVLGNYGFPCDQVLALPLIVSTEGQWRFPEAGDMIVSTKSGEVVWKLNRYLLAPSDQGLKILADQTYVNNKGKVVRCTSVPACARGINVWPASGLEACVIK